MAATEFALLFPIMILIFFGTLEAADAYSVSRRVQSASNSLADLIGQATHVTPSQVDDIFTGVKRILEPNDTNSLEINLISLVQDPTDPAKIIVHWSRDINQGEPYAPGEEYTDLEDDRILVNTSSLIVVELSYDYTSTISSRLIGAPIEFRKSAQRWPRRSARVQLCDTVDPTTNCTS